MPDPTDLLYEIRHTAERHAREQTAMDRRHKDEMTDVVRAWMKEQDANRLAEERACLPTS